MGWRGGDWREVAGASQILEGEKVISEGSLGEG